jgi:hypothetical protein
VEEQKEKEEEEEQQKHKREERGETGDEEPSGVLQICPGLRNGSGTEKRKTALGPWLTSKHWQS